MKYFKKVLALVLTLAFVISLVPGVYGEENDTTTDHVHDYIAQVIKEASHTENGLLRYTCLCNDFYEEETEALGHNYVADVAKEASCTENGVIIYSCSCGKSYEEKIEAQGHNYVIIEHTEPTQEVDGITVYACSVCSNEYTETKEHEDKYVAKMYICAKRGVSPLGHMWVYIENISNQPIEVGVYTVPIGQGVSIGAFGLTRADGIGIYYNVEAYTANKYGLKNVVCMQENLTKSDLEKVSQKVRNNNFWDPIILNCMGIAFSIWNSGASTKLISIVFPVFGRLQMLMHPHIDEINMYYPTESQVYKQKGIGQDARLENVSENTLSHGF